MSCDDVQNNNNNTLDQTGQQPLITPCGKYEHTKIVNSNDYISYDKFEALLTTQLLTLENNMRKDIKHAIDTIRQEFTQTTDFLSSQIKDQDNKLISANNRLHKLEQENEKLKADLFLVKKTQSDADFRVLRETISNLQMDINDKDQASLMNYIEVSGIPEFPHESVVHLIKNISKIKLGIDIVDTNIVSAMRVGAKWPAGERLGDGINQHGEKSSRNKPRPIVVQLAQKNLRDELIKQTKMRRNLTTADAALPPHEPVQFYVNERLTKTNRVILAKARSMKSKYNWKYVWTKEGRVYARYGDAPQYKVHLLRSEQDVERVFGITPNRTNNE
ncbi:hypothetical protein O0L34_g10340 [Tuta absoluta]|nr:hypothetical protein O0L34_g10340 [Tuta absoluta]